MKSRILTILSIAFAALVFSRAYAVSTDIVEPSSEDKSEQSEMKGKYSDGTDTHDTSGPNATKSTVSSADGQCLTGSIHKVVTADLKRLDVRKSEIAAREAALSQLEAAMKTQLSGIEAANADLELKINGLKSIAGEELKHLVSMYETMKPKQASEIFNSMDPAFAAGFLREMNANTAGLIMANMDARKSYTISVIIAGKNAKYR